MAARVWESGIVLLLAIWGMTTAESARVSASEVCSVETAADAILGFRDSNCVVGGGENVGLFTGVTEGDEVYLQRALNIVHRDRHQFVAVLFYASWCPFSRICRPKFSILSSLYPSIPHFAIEEAAVRPSILSKYGVHGFPTLFLLNNTMRVRYHGSRTLASLVAFYGDVTGIETASLDRTALGKIGHPSNHEKHNITDESCPFSWAKSPENLFRQETYLALATAFVILRLLYYILPALLVCAQGAWRRHIRNMSLWEHPLAYLNRSMQIFRSLSEPCKRSNLQGGAMNAKAWASKSLASVSIGDAGTSRGSPSDGR